MEVKNCRECRKLFNYLSGPRICPACKQNLESKYGEVRDYIRENKGATIAQVSEDCQVSQQQLQQWIREERLEFSEGSPVQLSCETCGARIRTGRYCESCKRNTADGFKKAITTAAPAARKESSSTSNRMRFLQ